MKLRKGEWSFAFFFTVSTIGMPCDVSLEDLRVMCFFPADNATDEAVHRVAEQVRWQTADFSVQIKSAT